MSKHPKIIVAIDRPDLNSALALARQLPPDLCRVKVGKELFTAAGPVVIEQLHRLGHQVFLDLKFHDIPNTVGAACRVAAGLGVWMLNVHAAGGRAMMEAAREAVENSPHRPLLIAVTLLTSMDRQNLRELGLGGEPEEWVARWGQLAVEQCGLDGLVCSAWEVPMLRRLLGDAACLVTPGIRPEGQQGGDDQKRVLSPRQALEAGSSCLVIGRPITQATDPARALREIAGTLPE